MDKIDHRRHYILMVDTETANGLDDPLVYDFGCAVVDTHGNVYEARSFVNKQIFDYERNLMDTAYYAEKIPMYLDDLEDGLRERASLYEIRQAVLDLIQRYNISEVCAHNARFDYNALNTTQRWLTKSKYRFFLPYGIKIWDTMKMAEDVIVPTPTYQRFCEENGYLTATGRYKKTAEILYRFISGDNEFIEMHTGLDDVLIEKEILRYCYAKHKKMRHGAWEKKQG